MFIGTFLGTTLFRYVTDYFNVNFSDFHVLGGRFMLSSSVAYISGYL